MKAAFDKILPSKQCYVQLKRPSDGVVSEPLPFEYLPLDTGRRSIWAPTRKDLKQKLFGGGEGLDFFQLLVANEQADKIVPSVEIIDLDTPVEGKPAAIPAEEDQGPMDGIETFIDHNGKTTEWINKTEFTTISNGSADETMPNEDKTLHELLDQVAELDEIYTDHQLRRDDNDHVQMELNYLDQAMPPKHHDIGGVDSVGENGAEENIDFDELFDDAATYSSLQIAFKNPISIVEPPAPPPPPHATAMNDAFNYDAVERVLNSPQSSNVDVSPLKRESPQLDEEKLPPLPPKRIKKAMPLPENDENEPNNAEENSAGDSLSRRGSSKSQQKPRPQSQIIIMKPPNQSPLNKKLPPAPPSTNKTAKSPGFFSKLFSRRKSKSDIENASLTSKSALDVSTTREPNNIHSFTVTESEPTTAVAAAAPSVPQNRASTHSNKSLQISNNSTAKRGKPVGRSVSSVSGKRPHLTADIVHIPLKGGDSSDSLPMRSGSGPMLALPGGTEAYERASTATLSNNLDRKTVSALQLADLPLQDGGMELIAIADRQSLRNLCEGEFGVTLDPSVDLTEAEHYALYTSVAPHATQSEFDEGSCYYAPVEAGEILTQDEVARRLAGQFS